MATRSVPLVLFGLGAIGRALARAAMADPGLRIVAAVDTDPSLTGRPLHSLWRQGAREGPRVKTTLAAVGRLPARAVLMHAAGSKLAGAAGDLLAAVERGLPVVSSCEELLWPWHDQPRLATRLDRAAKKNKVAVLGTGVNPGFVMDILPVVASAVSRDIRRVHVVRAVDAARRREPLQRKVGIGMTVAEFQARARRGEMGHVGLPESARLLASALGWRLDKLTNRLQPVVAGGRPAGRAGGTTPVEGQYQVVSGRCGRREVVRLELTMARGTRPDHDEIWIDGTPPLRLRTEPGAAGDEATVSALINGVFQVLDSPPGLVWNPSLRLPRGRIRT